MYQEGLSIPPSSALFTEKDRATAAAHERHISAGVQEADPINPSPQKATPESYIDSSHDETPKVFVDELGIPFSAETQRKMHEFEQLAQAMREIKDKTVDIDAILRMCTMGLELNSQKTSTDIVIRYKGVELARSHSNQVAIDFVGEKVVQSLRLQAVEYILGRRSQIPKVAIRYS